MGIEPAEGIAPPICEVGLHERVASFDLSAFYPAIVAGGGIRGFLDGEQEPPLAEAQSSAKIRY